MRPQVFSPSHKLKVAFLTVMPSPYMRELFLAMSRDERLDLQVRYLEAEAPDTLWGAPEMLSFEALLPGRWFNFLGGRMHVNWGFSSFISKFRPEVTVVAGYSGFTNQRAMRSLRRKRMKWIFFGERPGMRMMRGFRQSIRELAMSPVKSATAIAAVGSLAVNAYKAFTPGTSVVNLPYYTDISGFVRTPSKSPSELQDFTFLYCGQLIERKGVDLLVNSFSKVVDRYPSARLLMVGDGPLRGSLLNGYESNVRKQVVLEGFKTPNELPAIFSKAHAFVLPSRHDGWGVVVNQAIGSGLPLILSDAVGSAHDLLHQGQNGFLYSAQHPQQLTQAMLDIISNRSLRDSMATWNREFASKLSIDFGANQWIELFRELQAQ